MVPVQTGSETVSGNMGMPRPGTKRSGVFGKIPDWDWDRGVWSGSDQVPIGLGPNFPNTSGRGVTADEGRPWQGEGSGRANAIGKPFALCKARTRITLLKCANSISHANVHETG